MLGNIDVVERESPLKQKSSKVGKYVGIGALVLAANFFGNLTYSLLLNIPKRGILVEKKAELISNLDNAQSKLNLLIAVDCYTEKCNKERSRLYNIMSDYGKQNMDISFYIKEIEDSHERSLERGWIYGYFK